MKVEVDASINCLVERRLETDQLRDWHKPTADWSSTAPVVA